MSKKAKKKERNKKKGKSKTAVKEENDAIKEQSPAVNDTNETQETSNFQPSCSLQFTKGKFKTSRQRKRANTEQQLREEKSSTSKKKNKALTHQSTGFEKKGQTPNENKCQKKPTNSDSTEGVVKQYEKTVTENSIPLSPGTSTSNDMYNLRPSYIQNKDEKELYESGNWRIAAKQPKENAAAKLYLPPRSSAMYIEDHGDPSDGNWRNVAKPPKNNDDNSTAYLKPRFNFSAINNYLWPSVSEKEKQEVYTSGNWRTVAKQPRKSTEATSSESRSHYFSARNDIWPSDSEDNDPSGNWRKVARQPRKRDAANSSLYLQSGCLNFNAINNLWPSDIQNILAKEAHNLLEGPVSCTKRNQSAPDSFGLLRALAQACAAGKTDKLNRILRSLKGSDFLRHNLPEMLRKMQQENQGKIESDKRQVIVDMLSLYQTYLRYLPSAYSDLPLDEVQRYFRKLQVHHKSELEDMLDALKEERDELIQIARKRNAKPCKQVNINKKPPNNFRELQIFPTIHELTSNEMNFLRANVKKGSYQDAEHYLDVQFRLYREDFIAPLRDGIQEIVHAIPKNQRGQNIKTYDKVKITKKEYTRNGIIYRLHFDESKFRRTRWESSRRLVYGSFLCLSKDNFENTLFATVANRDPQELTNGFLDVSFIEGQNVYGIERRQNDQYVMAESPAYFEAYRHVLVALQDMREGSLPFQKYLVECNREVDAPAYLRNKEEVVRYDLSNALDVQHVKEAKDVPLLQPEKWPDVSHLPLNESQYEALRTALTKEFSVIQGPPGTGKTYVGLKIARCLLDNSHAWNPTQDSPILMVCFTNHALDQFLEGILDFLPKGIIRVGSRCKSERLEKCNLKNDVNIGIEQRFDTKRRLEKQLRRIEAKKLALEAFERNDGIKKIQILEDGNCISKEHLDSFYYSNLYDGECKTLQDVFEAWICNKTNKRRQVDFSGVTPEFKADCQVPSQQKIQLELEQLQNEGSKFCAYDDEDDWGVADSDLEVPGPDSFVSDNGSSESDDNWEEAYSDLESEDEFFDCNSHFHAQGWTEEKEKKNKDIPSMQKVMNKGKKKQEGIGKQTDTAGRKKSTASETIDINQEFEVSRQLDGEEDLYKPIIATLELSENEGEQSEDEITSRAVNETDITVQKQWGNESNHIEILCSKRKKSKSKRKKNTSSKATPSNIRRSKSKMKDLARMTEEEIETIQDIWDIRHDDRLSLYLTWVYMLEEDLRRNTIQEEQAYDGLCREVESARIVEEEKILRKAKVIGMTTTGAARYHAVLQRIKPRIVIIEEAAEVLEAHIITSLAKDTEQVILIGDHKQLRPKPTVHELAIKYNLEISLFERMVLNKMDCKMLSIQHRMRPEIAQLTKRIYKDDIYDDVSVTNFEDVRGLKTNLFFIDHREEEAFHNGLQSYANYHEADMMVAMCRYLLQQDYEPNQITILTLYIGQLLALKDKMPREEFDGVRVSVVDNYQGEENDIILLSLVRSNSIGSTGFLKESNRVCVALSRARKGLYCIGNFGLLSKERLWKDICEDLRSKGAINKRIELACVHHGEVTEVRKEDDFKKAPAGGCGRPCDLRLSCGHRCPERCHGSDPEHKDKYKCHKRCRALCPQELHNCRERCHFPEDCDLCPVLVSKDFLECGHKGRLACGIDPKTQNCEYIEYRTLQCGHQKPVPCFLDPLQSLQSQYDQTEGRLREVSKLLCSLKKPNNETEKRQPDFTKIEELKGSLNQCTEEFAKLKDRRLKIKKHWPAYEDALKCQENCISECARRLHICSKKCHYGKECGPCYAKVKVEIPKCGHLAQVSCYKNFETIVCKEMCTRLLKCGHPCKEECKVDCSSYKCQMLCMKLCKNQHPCEKVCHLGKPCNKCMVVTEKFFPNCNHKTFVKCHVDVSTVPCFMPCERRRQCGHPCDKWCYQSCDSLECNIRLLKTLPCGHQTRLPCYLEASQYLCTSLVIKALPCGHEMQMPCNYDPYQYTCMEEVMKKLTCGHESKMKCYSDPSKRNCREQVTKKLPCGHESKMQCHADPLKRQCLIKVMKKLSCGHEMEMECHFDPSKRKCREQVTKKLSCGHEFDMKCHSNPLKQMCTKPTSKKLPCGHEIQVPCCMDIPQRTCKEPKTKKLSCGHEIEMPCNEDPSQHTCQKAVMKELQCGHMMEMPCTSDALKRECTTDIERTLSCGHIAHFPCNKVDISQYECTKKVQKKLKCGHEIKVSCNSKLAKYVCKEQVMKKLPCGHENQVPCNVDPSNHICTTIGDYELQCGHVIKRACRLSKSIPVVICSEQVTKKLSCGHKHQMKCHLDPTQYICTKQVEKKLSCGHDKFMPCHIDVSRAICTEQIVRRLPCGHDNSMLCNFNPSNFQCKTPVMKNLKCGHVKEVLCFSDVDVLACNEMVEKKLSCQHSKKVLCFKKSNTVFCYESVEKELPCKHLKKVPCHESNADTRCYEEVSKTLPCKHEKLLPCYVKPESRHVKCNTMVTKTLPCSHQIEVLCNVDVDKISCDKLIMKKLPCSHEVEAPCNKNINTISCSKLVKKQLPCNHEAEVPCYKDVHIIACKEISNKQLLCGHKVKIPCNVDVKTISCDKSTIKTLPCSHDAELPCSRAVETVSCDKLVIKKLSCTHKTEIPCNVDVKTISCDVLIKKQLPCSHEVEIPCNKDVKTISCDALTKKQLSCGHKVEIPCNIDVKTISCVELTTKQLPCGHEVEIPCNIGVKTISCDVLMKKQLPCSHEVEIPCNKDVKTISCVELTKKQLPCGHEVEIPCNVDVRTIPCDVLTVKRLPCHHEAEIPCNVDVNAISCDVLTKKQLSCSHEVVVPCNISVKTISCNILTKKKLPCSHEVDMPCDVDVTTIICDELTKKQLPCSHKVEIPCNVDVNTIICDELTKKQLPCSHEVEVPCNVDVRVISCYKRVMKQLPCSHGDVKVPCNLDIKTISCRKPVLKQLPCSHTKELPCNVDVATVSCDTMMTKTLPCKHEIELPCNKDQREYICKRQCERFLPCNHRCKQKCYETCDSKRCTELTYKTLPCPNKHEITIPCNINVQDNFVCVENITKVLNCGHVWKGECSKSSLPYRCEIIVPKTLLCPGKHRQNLRCYVDVKGVQCGKKCLKTLPCGHPCKLYCDEPCDPNKCNERVLKTFEPCGHTRKLPCGKSAEPVCLYRCLRPLQNCGHPCQGSCGKPCNKLCLYKVRKTLPCGHRLKMNCCDPVEYVRCPLACTKKMDCGHICMGNCSSCQEKGGHESCPLPCGRALVCSHRCHGRCSDSCSPCFRECRGWCPHGKCQGKCSEACEPCSMPCAYTCPHQKCNNLCHEMCTREPCNKPCQKILTCGHSCIGLCGESCPTLCYVCTPEKVAAISPNRQKSKDLRFIQLKECGHVIEVNRMDAWMQQPLNTGTNEPAEPRRCPTCSVPIYFSFRYGNIVREALQNMFETDFFKLNTRARRRRTISSIN